MKWVYVFYLFVSGLCIMIPAEAQTHDIECLNVKFDLPQKYTNVDSLVGKEGKIYWYSNGVDSSFLSISCAFNTNLFSFDTLEYVVKNSNITVDIYDKSGIRKSNGLKWRYFSSKGVVILYKDVSIKVASEIDRSIAKLFPSR